MKTLVINGSPRQQGDTASLISELRKHLSGEIIEIKAYYDNIRPCIDCRQCWKEQGCPINDDMQLIYGDDFDNVVIASPIYMSTMTGPLVGLASRFQAYYAAKRFLKQEIHAKEKKAVLILTGGGDGKPDGALNLAKWMFKYMNASYAEDDVSYIFSLHTDDVPARDDAEAMQKIKKAAVWLNS